MNNMLLRPLAALVLGLSISTTALAADPPKVGDKAPDFTLKTLEDQSVRLSDLTAKGKVVLIVLRGWPGYQCPICERQVQEFIAAGTKFSDAKAQVIMVYPGPAEDLKAHAKEFAEMKNKQWPKEFLYVVDPDYTMINAYHLRWDAPKETSYPSTFVLDKKGTVRFAKISHTHGDRTTSAEVLEELKRVPME